MDDTNIKFIGELLRNRRKLVGLSLEKLAELTRSSKSYIWEVENGRTEPSGSKVLLMSMALGASMESFYGHGKSPDKYAAYIGTKVINMMREEANDQ